MTLERQTNAMMAWPDIKAEIEKRGMTLSSLATVHGYHPTSLAAVKLRRASPAQALIAAFIGQRPEDLWPDRYDTQGNPIGAKRRKPRPMPQPIQRDEEYGR